MVTRIITTMHSLVCLFWTLKVLHRNIKIESDTNFDTHYFFFSFFLTFQLRLNWKRKNQRENLHERGAPLEIAK